MGAPLTLGPYLLLERIGAGGMAEVWRAAPGEGSPQTRFNTLAVKKILPHVAENEEFRKMFVAEAVMTVKLAHPNIAQVTDFGESDGALFMAMEYVPGKDLHSIFHRSRSRAQPMSVALACFVISEVCAGLEYAHTKRDIRGNPMNVVHRDVSLNNILVTWEGAVKLIDFGIARAAKNATGKARALSGNPRYMSPELASGKPSDARSDIFALGACLYSLILGEPPFDAETNFGVIEKIRTAPVTAPTVLNPDVPEELESIILQALEKEPEKRFQSAMDMQTALDGFATGSGFLVGAKELAAYVRGLFPAEFEAEVQRIAEEESEEVLELDDALPE